MTIQVDDIKIEYIPIREAKQMLRLRIVLGAFALPGAVARSVQRGLLRQRPRLHPGTKLERKRL